VRVNDLAFRRFRIERKAGSGGMGTVYRATDTRTNEPVALKVIRADDDVDHERFLREAAALARVVHPAVVRYVDHGTGEDGHYLAMEWLEGEDLGARLAREGLTVGDSVAVAAAVASALGAAHAHGIVHRDVKPRNIFLVGGAIERVKVLDFGIALLREGAELTVTGAMLGTPGYMAPEQAEGARDLDARADVFSLGCVLFRCLAGEAPFAGESLLAVLAKTVLEESPRVSDFRLDVPPDLDDLVARLLAKDKAHRPADGHAVATELAGLGGVRVSAPAPVAAPSGSLTEGERRVLSVVIAGGAGRGVKPTTARERDAAPGSAFAASRAKEAGIRLAAARFGGHVESLAEGSHLVTIVGEGAATDLAAQAARCALALRDLLPEMPIALATGAGVAASAPHASRPAFALVDRAVALVATDRPGIRLDDVTAGLLDVRFAVESDGGGLTLRGERDVIEAQRTLLGRPYPCVGRDSEIEFLDGIVQGAFASGVVRAALVTAPAGRGKSRVRFEVLRRVKERGERATVLFARGDSVSAGSPFGLLAPAIRRAAGVLEGEPSGVTRKRLRARVGRHVRPELVGRVSAFLGELAGLPPSDDDPVDLREARRDAVLMGDALEAGFLAFLDAEVAAQPVALVLEDLHWGDLPSVRFVDAALRELDGKRFCVLAFARPEVHATFPDLWAGHDVQELRLSPLGPTASTELARGVLGDAASDDVIARVVERAGGNAFYLEELIRAVAQGTPSDALPETILGMVQTRLDAMGAEVKRTLRAASVFGQTFWLGGVTALLGGDARSGQVKDLLHELVDREVIAAQGEGGIAGESAFIFRHALLRDAAYAMLTDHDRTLGHRLAGAWLEDAGLAEPMVLAEHFDRGEVPARAAVWYRRAAEHALEGNDLAGAVEGAERAIRCGAAHVAHGELRLVVCEAHKWRGRLADAYGFGVEAARHLVAGSPLWFRAVGEVIALAGQLARIDDLAVWTAEAARATPVDGNATPRPARRAGSRADPAELYAAHRASRADAVDTGGLREGSAGPGRDRSASRDVATGAKVVALCRAVSALLQLGRRDEADAVLDLVQQVAPNLGKLDRRTAARVHTAWATRALHMGHFGAALTEHVQALTAFDAAGDVRNVALTHINVGVEQIELGDYESAEESLLRALRAASRMGLANVRGWAQNNLGHVLVRLGRLDEARDALDRAAATGRAQGSRRLEVASIVYGAKLDLVSGDAARAVERAREAATLAAEIPPLRASALAVLARALLALGGHEGEALECATEAYELVPSSGSGEGEGEVWLARIEALAAVGDEEGARAAAASAKASLLARATMLDEVAAQGRMLRRVSENARILEIAAAYRV
jgi:tetratricopeptide (TPR) repeat protein